MNTALIKLYTEIQNRETGEIYLADIYKERDILGYNYLIESKLWPEYKRQISKYVIKT